MKFSIEPGDEGKRLDKVLPEKDDSISRSGWKKRIDEGRVLVNGKTVKSGFLLTEGDEISYEPKPPYVPEGKPVDFTVIWEDEDLAIIHKPAGLTVHPGAGEEEETLVHGLLHRFQRLYSGTDPLRPGIVHRLDRDTCGLLVIAKSEKAGEALIQGFKRREMDKEYVALVKGRISEPGEIHEPIGRHPVHRKKMAVVEGKKPASTIYRPIYATDKYSLLRIQLITGRTHQIRVHMAHIHHPVVGDPVYGSEDRRFPFQCLQSTKIGFFHPINGNRLEVELPIPANFISPLGFKDEEALFSALRKEERQWGSRVYPGR